MTAPRFSRDRSWSLSRRFVVQGGPRGELVMRPAACAARECGHVSACTTSLYASWPVLVRVNLPRAYPPGAVTVSGTYSAVDRVWGEPPCVCGHPGGQYHGRDGLPPDVTATAPDRQWCAGCGCPEYRPQLEGQATA